MTRVRPDRGGEAPPVLDWEVARRHIPAEDDGIRVVAGLLLDDLPRRLAEIRRGVRARGLDDVRRAAHSVKGAALHFGAQPTIDAALAVETAAAADDLPATLAAIPPLEEALERLGDALREFLKGGAPPP